MSFDPDAFLTDGPAPAPAPAPATVFNPDAFLADDAAPALFNPNLANTARSTVTGFTASEAQARGEAGAAGFAAVGNDTLQAAPTAIRIAGPAAAVAAGTALIPVTGGLSLPASMLLAGGGSLAVEPSAQMAEKALGQRQDYSVAEGAINVAAGTIPGVRFANLPLASAAQRTTQILTRAAEGAAQAAAQDVGTRYVRGEDDVFKTAGQSALIGAGFGGLVGTAFDEIARKLTLNRMFTTARQAGFAGETVDDLRNWWQGPPAAARPPGSTAPEGNGTLATRPQVLDLEIMPAGDPIIPAAARPLALPSAPVPRDLLRLMPGTGPLALPAPQSAPAPAAPLALPAPTPSPVAVDPVLAAPPGPNLPEPATPPPSATVQSLPAPQAPEPFAATTPTPLPEPVANNENPTAAVPLPGAEQPAAPAPDVKPAPRPYAKLTAAELKAKIKSLTDGIAKPSQTATRVAKLTKDLAPYQAEAALRRAEKAASGKGKGRGFGIGPDARGDEDLLNAVEAAGGIRTRGDNTGGESDGFAREASGIIRLLRRKDAPEITTMLGELADDFGYRFDTVSDFEQALERAVATRKRTAQLVEAEQQTELFRRAALENKGRGGTDPSAKPIAPGKITEGDTFEVKGEPVKVAAIDPETDTITLKDGERFGTQEVPAGVTIYADAKTYKPAAADKAGLKWGDVAKQRDARMKAERDAGAQDWDAVLAANHAEAVAAVDGLLAPRIDAAPNKSTVTNMASDTGAAPQSRGSPQSGPDIAEAYLEGIHANGRKINFSDLGLSIRDKAQVSGKLKDPNLYKKAKKVGEVGIFWRNGAPPESGRSFNFKDQRSEIGVSVYSEPYATSFAGQTDRPWYRIEGKIVGFGSDSEPLVEVISSKRISEKQREVDISWHNAHKKYPVFLPGDVIEIPQYGDIYESWGSQYVVIDIAKTDTGKVYGYAIAPDWTVHQYPPLRDGPSYVSFDEEMLGKHTIFSRPPATIREDLREKGFSILKANLDKYLTQKSPNPTRTAQGAPSTPTAAPVPPPPATALIPRSKAQTVDMFDSGSAAMDFTMAGETTTDATGNMDRVAQAAADKAAADAAQGGLFGGKLGGALGYNDWEQIRRRIDPQSVLPTEARDAIRYGTQAIGAHILKAQSNQADLLRALNGAAKTTPNVVALTRDYLDGNLPLASLPAAVRVPAQNVRTHVDQLTLRAVREGVVKGQLALTLLDNVGKYLRRSYRIFDDAATWTASREYQIARREWIADLLTQPNPATPGLLYNRNAAETLTNQLTDREAAAAFMIGGKVAGRDVSSLIRRKELPPKLRALYGEILDPIEAYGQTIPRLARLVENHYAQQWIRLVGLRAGIFETSPSPLNHRPLVSDSNQPHEVWQGLYTQPVIARALEREVTTSSRQFSTAEAFFKIIRTLTGLSKMTKTVMNPDSYAPNFIGGIITSLANGNFNLLPGGRGLMLAAEELGLLRAAGIMPATRQALKDDLVKLAKLGLRSEGLDASDLIRTWETSLLPKMLGRAKRVVMPTLAAYGQIDNVTKYLAWKSETARLKVWMPAGTPLETLERMAAERVRATTQVYGKVPKIITDLSRLGIAPSFVSFTWELFRNTANTARIAAQDMAEGARNGNARQQWDGARRLASLVAVVSAGLGITALSRRENNISDEVDEAVRFFGPKYDENASLHYNTPLKDGRVNVSNVSYLLPHMLLTEAVVAGMRGDTGEEQTQQFLGQLTKQFMAADGGVFIGPAMETFVGYNRDTGLPVYNRQSPTPGLDAMGYLGDRTLTPLFLRKVENYVKASRDEIGPNGKVFSAADENWRLVGARQQTRDLNILAGYKARDLSRQWVDSSRLYTQLQGRNVPAEDLEAGYQRAAQARQKVAAKVADYFRLGLVADISQDELIKNLRAGQGLSAEELLGVIDGKYVDQPRDRQQSAVQVLDRARRLPEEKRMAAVAAEIIKDPKLVKGIMREGETLAKGITQQDRLILGLNVSNGSRARYIANQITTQRVAPADVGTYLSEARRKGILTDEVYRQLKTGDWQDLDQ